MSGLKSHIIFCLSSMLLLVLGCIEPFEAETLGFEGLLVVDARLTDEDMQHEVFLSRLTPFEQDSITVEKNAKVSILENSGTSYDFMESSPGRYVSTSNFAGKVNQTYQLLITTADGVSFSSSSEVMPENVDIADLTIKRDTIGFGDEGIAVVLDNSSFGNRPRYFRYTYEEAYKIVAPNWDPFEFEIIDDIPCADGDAFEVGIKPKIFIDRICYGQKSSTDIILASTEDLEGSNLSNFMIRFINRNNYILSHRYSIIVNQYTQNANAHAYYQNLDAFSSSESIFSEIQPGFLEGNIVSSDNSETKVIGYFEAAAVSSKRVYFNYEDFFPQEPLPDYPFNCSTLGNPQLVAEGFHCTTSTPSFCDGNCVSPLIDNIKANLLVFAGEKEPFDINAPYLTLPRACGDCTVLGSTIKPDFWIE